MCFLLSEPNLIMEGGAMYFNRRETLFEGGTDFDTTVAAQVMNKKQEVQVTRSLNARECEMLESYSGQGVQCHWCKILTVSIQYN